MMFRVSAIVVCVLAFGSFIAATTPHPNRRSSESAFALSSRRQAAPASTPRSAWDGVYSEEQAKRGVSLYLDECARCHSESLAGGDFGPAIAGDAFMAAWSGKTLGDVFDRIQTTMPLDSPGRLSRRQYADLVAYMLQVSHFPAGATALLPEPAGLTAIKIESRKPGQR